MLLNPASGKCLSAVSNIPGTYLSLEFCNKNDGLLFAIVSSIILFGGCYI